MNLQKGGKLELQGRWRLTAKHNKTGEIIIKEGENLIATIGKEFVGDILIGEETTNTQLTYCALGSNDTLPTEGDTTLRVEEVRKAITSRSRTGNEITLATFFTAAESAFIIEEAGIFGKNASLTLDSGTLFSHWLVPFDNSGGVYDITISYILTIG